MKHQSFPEGIYREEIARLGTQLHILKKKKDAIAWARFTVIAVIAVAIYYLHTISIAYTSMAVIILLAVFIRLVILAVNNRDRIDNCQRLVSINENEIKIAAGEYHAVPDGSGFLSPLHGYANDLDIFGKGSLYQYTNRTQTEQGNALYAAWLLQPAETDSILQRQQAAKALSPQYQWRQQLQAYGIEQPITLATEQKINTWVASPDSFSNKLHWKLTRYLYPVIATGILVLYMADMVPGRLFFAAYIMFLLVSLYVSKIILKQYMLLNKIVPEITTLSNSAAWIEKNPFQDVYLEQIQSYFTSGHIPSSVAIKKLKSILDKFDFNLNMLFLILVNPFLLFNLQVIFELEKWRRNNKENTTRWFAGLAAMEAIASVANISHNHPRWVFPTIDTTAQGTLQATGLGHPLLPEDKCVVNDFYTRGPAQVALITGSNMAGKSTFLRSIGVNTVMAMMGSPVFATEMTISVMRIISSMRVADNLQESTSTFYAELKKLQSIIESVNRHEHVFVLLDEILRGTNSLDRHTGSKALVKQLINKAAVAMLATHDVELAQLQSAYPVNIRNYHFDAQIANEELFFDYKLKEGICRSINASILMKKIGIEL